MRLRERGALSPFPVSERREIAHSERLAVHMGPNMTLEPSRCGVLPAKLFPPPVVEDAAGPTHKRNVDMSRHTSPQGSRCVPRVPHATRWKTSPDCV